MRTSNEANLKVIYGKDDRRDLFQIGSNEILGKRPLKDYASQIALIIYQKQNILNQSFELLENISQEEFKIKTEKMGASWQLCQDENFFEQPIPVSSPSITETPGMCTGFLIDKTHLVTAGHCLLEEDANLCSNMSFVFNYSLSHPEKDPSVIAKDDVYFCKSVLSSHYNLDEHDFAVLELDRPVKQEAFLNFRRLGKISSRNQPLTIMGHPMGLPLKTVTNGELTLNDQKLFFSTNLDAMPVNSGSPVFNREGEVEGILIASYTVEPLIADSEKNCKRIAKLNSQTLKAEKVFRANKIEAFPIMPIEEFHIKEFNWTIRDLNKNVLDSMTLKNPLTIEYRFQSVGKKSAQDFSIIGYLPGKCSGIEFMEAHQFAKKEIKMGDAINFNIIVNPEKINNAICREKFVTQFEMEYKILNKVEKKMFEYRHFF